jgi:DNA-binding Lrp family transcriptional regulator
VITAIVLVETSTDMVPEAAERIAEIDGVREVYSVTGDVDLVAIVRVPQHEDLAGVIADRLGKVEGVVKTQTYLAFRQYSKPDLEAAFDLGLDDA